MKKEAQEEFEKLVDETVEPKQTTSEPVQTPKVDEIEYLLGGKANKLPVTAEIAIDGKRAPLQTILNHYRQRTKLDSEFGQFKKDREAFDAERKQLGDLSPYIGLQKWSVENPKDADYLMKLFENRDKHFLERDTKGGEGQTNAQPLIDQIMELKRQLAEVQSFQNEFDKRAKQEQDELDIKEINSEVEAFGKEFPEINLDEKNPDGLALKHQIMLFGTQHNIPDFESAALRFLKPKLLEIAQARGRTEAVKGVKQANREGVIARSSTPHSGQSSEVNPVKMNPKQFKEAARAELEELMRTG